MSNPSEFPSSHIYYFQVGSGVWQGNFTFRVISWSLLARSKTGVVNKVLAALMHAAQRLAGPSCLDSTIMGRPNEGPHGVAENQVIISKWGIPLYVLHERYVLDGDGSHVTVQAVEHFGPFPRWLRRVFTYPAEIVDDGLGSVYYMPLLGAAWTATYQVVNDRQTLVGELVCEWAKGQERAHKDAVGA